MLFKRAGCQLFRAVHRHDQLTALDGMSMDTMTAVLSYDRPPIPFEEADGSVHWTICATGWAWACRPRNV